jgi:hypothetical protein
MVMSLPRSRAAPPFPACWLVAAVLWTAASPALAQRAVLSHAEQPAKLIRKTTVYDAPAGTSLQPGDIVESGARGVQVEWANGALMALGPGSSMQLDSATGTPAVNLLRGWMKLSASRPAPTQLVATAGPLDMRVGDGSAIVHLAADQTELFVERGALAVVDRDKGGAPVSVTREQHALRRGALPLQLTPRPPQPFIAAMPRTFFDPLVAIAGRARPAKAAPLREVGAQDLADWRDVPPTLHKRLVAQFAARLADPVFAKDAETLLGANPQWRMALRQNTVAKQRAKTVSNHLF